MNESSESRGTSRSREAREGAAYPRRLIAASARLLDVQYLLWQRDLKDAEQPLIEYGFRLLPDPAGIDGRACRYDTSDGQSTILLDELLVHGRTGGHAVAVDRRTLSISTAWIHEWSSSLRLVRSVPPEADFLVPRLISWIGGYEQWVLDSGEDGSRSDLVKGFGLGDELPALWWRLAAEWRVALARSPLAR